MPAHQRCFEHGRRERIGLHLEQQPQPFRDSPTLESRQMLAVQFDAAGGGRPQSGQRVQRQGLAHAVRTENADEGSGRDRQSQVRDELAIGDADVEVMACEVSRHCVRA